MRPRWTLPPAALAALVALTLASVLLGAAPRSNTLEPGKLIILSTTDAKGHDDPCG